MEKLPTRQEKINDIAGIMSKLGCVKLSLSQYRESGGKFTKGQIYSNGDTWGELCTEAGGDKDRGHEPVPDHIYFERLKEFVHKKGRLPKTSERTLAGLNFMKRRWLTLSAFIGDAIAKGVIDPSYRKAPVADASHAKTPVPSPSPVKDNEASMEAACQGARRIPPIPSKSKRRKWARIDVPGFPYAPHDEQGVVALFAVLCNRGGKPWQILDINGGKGIDAICWDDERNIEFRVEFKYVLSKQSWNHPVDNLDLVVCWRNQWLDFPKPVFELEKFFVSGKFPC